MRNVSFCEACLAGENAAKPCPYPTESCPVHPEPSTITAMPSLKMAAKMLALRDDADKEISRVRANIDAKVGDLTRDLQEQITKITEQETANFAPYLKEWEDKRDEANRLYHEEIADCVAASVMEEDQYYLKNTTRATYPVNVGRFKKAFPDLFDKIATVTKETAKAAIISDYNLKPAVAAKQLAAVCDEVREGPPKWELAITKREGKEK